MFFFFFKQKPAYEMRISDWSSDVCSSDLLSDPHLWFHHRRGDDPQRADDAGRELLARARPRDGLNRAAPVDPGGQLSVEPDRRGGRPGFLRAARRLGDGEQGLGPVRPGLFGSVVRWPYDPLAPPGPRGNTYDKRRV